MTRKFVLATDPLTAEQEKSLADKLSPAVYWHWLPNFWLIVDKSETLTASAINKFIAEITDRSRRCLVTQVEAQRWAAQTRKDDKGNDMADWIRRNWEN